MESYLEQYLAEVPKEVRKKAAISFFAALDLTSEKHPKVAAAILKELQDQRSNLKLIASENFSSLTTQLTMGNLLTDKYSEGFSHHRFYAGCENVDTIEDLASQELKSLFGADHAYVQPHSGADANLIAFWGVLFHKFQNPELQRLGKKTPDQLTREEHEKIRQLMVNQKMMGMSLNSGGHLTHGFRQNISSKMMESVVYDVDKSTERLDYKAIEKQAMEERPTILLAGYSAYPRLINFAKMREIADKVGAVFIVDMAHFAGLVAGKVMQGEYDPVPYAHIVTSTTHKTLRGPRGGLILCTGEYREVIDKGCPFVIGGPLPHVMAAKAVAFKEANTPEFQSYARQIVDNARAFASRMMEKGMKLVTDGTDNHLIVFNVAQKFGLSGRQAETALREAGITTNRNAVPFDENGAWYTSGIRIGTPALTTLGMKEPEMEAIADMIVRLLKSCKPAKNRKTGGPSRAFVEIDEAVLQNVHEEAGELLKRFPLYPELSLEKMGMAQT